jgi:sporulation protein YlmC with PRC-barrel domain
MKLLKKKLVMVALVPMIGLPIAGSSFAEGTDKQRAATGQSQQQSRQAQNIRDMRASEIIGAKVQSNNGQDLGDVQDLIVNADDGQVDYVIVAFGGFLGFGEKLFAYPVDRFNAADDGKQLVLTNVTEQQMKDAPGFDRSTWPTFGMGGYRGEVEKHFGQTAKSGGNLVRMSQMLDKKIVDRAGNDIGEVEDVVVSLKSGKVRFVALNPDRSLDMQDQLVMLPMSAIRATSEQRVENRQQGQQSTQSQQQAQQAQSIPEQQGQSTGSSAMIGDNQQRARQNQQDRDLALMLRMDRDQLKNARTMKEDRWADLNNPGFQRETDQYVASFPQSDRTGASSGASGGEEQGGASTSGSNN